MMLRVVFLTNTIIRLMLIRCPLERQIHLNIIDVQCASFRSSMSAFSQIFGVKDPSHVVLIP